MLHAAKRTPDTFKSQNHSLPQTHKDHEERQIIPPGFDCFVFDCFVFDCFVFDCFVFDCLVLPPGPAVAAGGLFCFFLGHSREKKVQEKYLKVKVPVPITIIDTKKRGGPKTAPHIQLIEFAL